MHSPDLREGEGIGQQLGLKWNLKVSEKGNKLLGAGAENLENLGNKAIKTLRWRHGVVLHRSIDKKVVARATSIALGMALGLQNMVLNPF